MSRQRDICFYIYSTSLKVYRAPEKKDSLALQLHTRPRWHLTYLKFTIEKARLKHSSGRFQDRYSYAPHGSLKKKR